MNTIKISYDQQSFKVKPSGNEVGRINNRMARSAKILGRDELKRVVTQIGSEGCTFSPVTFKNGKRNKENFEQQQLFVLDFDNKDPRNKITFDEVKERADHYELPILSAYDTLSSTQHDKFRVVFLNDVPIPDRRVAEAMQLAIGRMFPEADPSCYKDVSKLYFGGKGMLYYDDKLPEINIESIFRNYTYCMRKRYKDNHYKEHIARFSKETGVTLTKKGLLDIKVKDHLPESDDPTEDDGAHQYYENGKNSPFAIIYNQNNSNIKVNGENFPNKYYIINFNGTRSSSVKTPDKKPKNHKDFRSGVLQEMEKKCRLFYDYANGNRKLLHDELFGIATNLLQVENGKEYFIEKRLEYPDLYPDDMKNDKWETNLSYMEQNNYYPQSCDNYCPYSKDCIHNKNILSTVHPKRGSMEKVAGYREEFSTLEEMQEDVYNAVNRAFHSCDKKYYIIKAQTGAGKSHSYLKLMQEHSDARFLIAVPTNLLKREIYKKARKQGIKVMRTPSLEEIKDEIPSGIWKKIQGLYKRGLHHLVHPFIKKELEKKDNKCLREYLCERDKLKTWKGCVITTHRYLLTMDRKRLDEFDSAIIDEDIIFKSIISNQGEITVSELKKLKRKNTDRRLSGKINKMLKASRNQSCIMADSFIWDDEENDKGSAPFDLPAFCRADRFYLRRKSREQKLDEDTFTFLKPADFPGEKYIMVSATVDEEICGWYFGEEDIDFYECKKAEYMGELRQYPARSMSRSSLASEKGIIERLMQRFGIDGNKVITFMKEQIGHLYFGNTEGSNTLEGKDILVIGTPYHAEFLYKLVAFLMGVRFDEKERMVMQEVIYNGYRFRFTTFENEMLKRIVFWMIESELEQAVGRARLLRNACTVHLFSNFPLSQSKMIRDFDYEKN